MKASYVSYLFIFNGLLLLSTGGELCENETSLDLTQSGLAITSATFSHPSCALSITLTDTTAEGIFISYEGSLSCESTLNIQSDCDACTLEYTCGQEGTEMYWKDSKEITMKLTGENSEQFSVILDPVYPSSSAEEGKLSKGLMIIVIVVVVLVVLSCIGVPICVCLGCKRGANGRRGPAGAELGERVMRYIPGKHHRSDPDPPPPYVYSANPPQAYAYPQQGPVAQVHGFPHGHYGQAQGYGHGY